LGNSSLINRVGNTEQKIGGSSQVVNTESWVAENSANTESPFLKNSANTENWLMQDSWGGGRKPEEKRVFLQAKGQLHGGAQGVFPGHKNADCKRCVKESWPRKKKKKSGTIGLTVYNP
jgi:hypothetical protein